MCRAYGLSVALLDRALNLKQPQRILEYLSVIFCSACILVICLVFFVWWRLFLCACCAHGIFLLFLLDTSCNRGGFHYKRLSSCLLMVCLGIGLCSSRTVGVKHRRSCSPPYYDLITLPVKFLFVTIFLLHEFISARLTSFWSFLHTVEVRHFLANYHCVLLSWTARSEFTADVLRRSWVPSSRPESLTTDDDYDFQ